jgi:glutathione S-transferase
MAAMKLYYVPRTRSGRPRWLLEELGVPFELQRLDPKAGDNKKPEYLKVHPLGHVPAFEDDGMHMIESAAICAYLADKYPEKKMAPPHGSTDRGKYYQWLFFGMATLEPPIANFANHTRMWPEERRIKQVADDAVKRLGEILPVLSEALGEKDYLLGDFTAADVIIGGNLIWAFMIKMMPFDARLTKYVERLMARPAWKKATAD